MNHWKLTTISLLVVVVTAVATGLVVARWYGPEISRLDVQSSKAALADAPPVAQLPPRTMESAAASPATGAPRKVATSSVPPRSVTDACNQVALRESGANVTTKDRSIDIVKDAAVGAVGGAGTLYGIYASRQNDEKYRASYAACMKRSGYTT